MKLGITLIVWGIVLALALAFRAGVQYVIGYGEGEFAFACGAYIGSWLVFGGVPLALGAKRITRHEGQG